VTLSGRRANLDQEIVDLLHDMKDRYIYVPCDVRRKEDLQRLWDLSVEKWGEIDIWINNAGVNTPHAFALLRMPGRFKRDVEPRKRGGL